MSAWPDTLALALVQGASIPQKNLQGWWSANTIDLYDTSGNARHGSVSGATLSTSGVSGSCLSFDGSNDFATLYDIDAQAFSISFWLKTAISSDVAMKYGDAGNRSWVIKLTAGVVVFQISQAGTTLVDFSSTGTVADGAWHHIVCEYSAGNYVKIFIDGQIDLTDTGEPAAIKETTASIIIGKGPSDFLTGFIDEVRFYDKALSATEVLDLYLYPSPIEALPEYPGQDGYGEVPQDGTIRSETDIGPGKTRQRSTAVSTYFSSAYWLTRAQRLILDDFYKRVLRGGSLTFTWPHPDGYTATVRFRSPPEYSPRNQDVTAAVSLEVLP